MKFKILLILSFLLIITNCVAQKQKSFYIEKTDDFKITTSRDGKTVLQSYLLINRAGRFDSYHFIIQTNFKGFNESSKKLEKENVQYLNINDFKNMEPCEIHEFFSDNKNVFLIYKENDKLYGWNLFYDGTSKNTISTVQTTRI